MTVEHSGTNFLMRYLIGTLGLHGSGDAGKISKESTADFAHLHPSAGMLKGQPIQDGIFDSVIITLRHPYRTTQTGKLRGVRAENVADGWQHLLLEKKKYNKVMFLTIDGDPKDRFGQLMAIAEHFGKADKVEQIRAYADAWEPVNQSLTDEDRSAMQFAVTAYEKWA